MSSPYRCATMWTLVAVALSIALPAGRAESFAFTEKFDRSHPFRADGEITLSNINGAVTIRTWDRNEVRIEGEKRAATEEELALIAVNLDLTETRLNLKTAFPKRRGLFKAVRGEVIVTLTVPAAARLRDIGTTNGSIALEGTRGPVRAHSVNGRLSATGLAGDASLETVNGALQAAFASVSREQKISVRTVNGPVTIAFPKDPSLHIRARSVNGSIECEFPLPIEGKKGRHGLSGTLGQGGADVEAETVNGSIRVKQL